MLWMGMGGHRSLLMGMVWVWVQIRGKMLGSNRVVTTLNIIFSVVVFCNYSCS